MTSSAFDNTSGFENPNLPDKELQDCGLNNTSSTDGNDGSAAETRKLANQRMRNPLDGITFDELRNRGRKYAQESGLTEPRDVRAFELGAILAQNRENLGLLDGELNGNEITALENETKSKWKQPPLQYIVVVICSICAAVQGMDETVVNGAQIFYSKQFGIDSSKSRDKWLVGFVNGAPYLCSAILGCWLTEPINRMLGRKGAITLTCIVSFVTCIAQAFANNWWMMFIFRFLLGLGIGPKSATVPMYAAECAPTNIRGALVMMWQVFTAFGIMIGYVCGLAFYFISDRSCIVGFNWRLMMASAGVPALFVFFFIRKCPESPRWLMSKGRHAEAYKQMCRLRYERVQAGRDLFLMAELLAVENNLRIGVVQKIKELVTIPRNRRAMMASQILMFMQQFCGVNIIAYYSSVIFEESGFSHVAALAASLGFGTLNFFGALPSIPAIDTYGRRPLLLVTFPLMSAFLLLTGLSFLINQDKVRLAVVAVGIYLFGIVYSPGAGPVPFTYSAEAYPLYIRSIGMSLATATTWFFNFLLAVTFPSLSHGITPTGAFGCYAFFNLIGFFLVLFFVPETKGRTLEELDQVFGIPTSAHAKWAAKNSYIWARRNICRDKTQNYKPLITDGDFTDNEPADNGEKA